MGALIGAATLEWFQPDVAALGLAVVLDVVIGDPVYRAHPIRLIGSALSGIEAICRRIGLSGRVGGILLFVVLSGLTLGALIAWGTVVVRGGLAFAWLAHVFVLYSFLAIGDLAQHVWHVETAAAKGDLDGARRAALNLVGRDADRMDLAACRRAAVESLGENLADGFTSALFWYAVAGLPGLTLFKVVSTMDSMVGYRTPRYLYFGWCGARLDDLMNFIPARLTWLIVSGAAAIVPGCSGGKAFRIGLRQHALLPGPNSGWSETAVAGGIQRRLVGPIWRNGSLVTELWIGDAGDPPLAHHADVVRALQLALTAAALATFAAAVFVAMTGGLVFRQYFPGH